MSLPILKVRFTDEVYGVGNYPYIVRALERHFVIRESEDPDLVVFGEGKEYEYKHYRKAVRIYVAVENRYPNFAECDYALTFLYLEDPRHLRMPMYVFDSEPEKLIRDSSYADTIQAEERDFCAFVVSNASRRTGRRMQFFEKLNAIRTVNSGGRAFNNVGGPVADKAAFLRKHRFNLCFENHFWPGYTTEKLGHALAAGCIPIYWGNPAVAADFNPASFIHVSDFACDGAAIDHILKVAESPELQRKYLQAPSFAGNQLNQYYDIDRLADFFRGAVVSPRRVRARISLRPTVFKLQRKFGLY
jgi:hypothetical protein